MTAEHTENTIPNAATSPGGRWWLEQDEHGVTARDGHGAVAHVEVQDRDSSVRLVFWLDERLPRELRAGLTRTVFEHPALRPRRRVAVALPHGDPEVLQEVRAHVGDASTRVAGATCLVDGRVR